MRSTEGRGLSNRDRLVYFPFPPGANPPGLCLDCCRALLFVVLLFLHGCSPAVSPAMQSIALDMLTEAARLAKENGQTLPKFAHLCDAKYERGLDIDRMYIYCEWKVPRK